MLRTVKFLQINCYNIVDFSVDTLFTHKWQNVGFAISMLYKTKKSKVRNKLSRSHTFVKRALPSKK